MTEHWKAVNFDQLHTPQEGPPQEVEFPYPSSGDGKLRRRRGMVVDLYGTPSIKLFNLGSTGVDGKETPPNRLYSTFSLSKVVGEITLIAEHPDWVAPS
jgi:hypothetical protein